jgi:hypothetical protein
MMNAMEDAGDFGSKQAPVTWGSESLVRKKKLVHCH